MAINICPKAINGNVAVANLCNASSKAGGLR